MKDTSTVPILFSVIFGFSTLLAWRGGQGTWLFTDFAATMLAGISLLLTPEILLEYQTDVRLDPVSIHLARVVGLLLLSSSLTSHRAFSSGDRLERNAVAKSRAVTAIMFLLSSTYVQPSFVDADSRGVAFFLLVDHFATATLGLAWYAFPQWLLRMLTTMKPNGVSVHVARLLGSLLVGNSLMSLSITNIPSLTSKKFAHTERIITAILLLILVMYAQTFESFSVQHIFAGIAVAILWTINSLFGYMAVAYVQLGDEERERRKAMVQAVAESRTIPTVGETPGREFKRKQELYTTYTGHEIRLAAVLGNRYPIAPSIRQTPGTAV